MKRANQKKLCHLERSADSSVAASLCEAPVSISPVAASLCEAPVSIVACCGAFRRPQGGGYRRNEKNAPLGMTG
jgi:hypothetical protein